MHKDRLLSHFLIKKPLSFYAVSGAAWLPAEPLRGQTPLVASYSGSHCIQLRLSAPRQTREKFVRKICAITVVTLVLSSIARAQFPTGGNAFFGYSYLHGETFTNGGTGLAVGGGANMSGWETSVEGKYFPWLGVVADLDWHYGGHDNTACAHAGPCQTLRVDASRDTLAFGPRGSFSFGRYRPFGEFLLGVGYQSDKGSGVSNSDLTFVTAFGGGVDYRLIHSVALRAQAHMVHTSFFGRTQYDPRISTGIVFRF
jgi:hypothetical protein